MKIREEEVSMVLGIQEVISFKSMKDLDLQTGMMYSYRYPEINESVLIEVNETISLDYQASCWFKNQVLLTFEFKKVRMSLSVVGATAASLMDEQGQIIHCVSVKDDFSVMKEWIRNDQELFALKDRKLKISQSNQFQLNIQGASEGIKIEAKTVHEALIFVLLQMESYAKLAK